MSTLARIRGNGEATVYAVLAVVGLAAAAGGSYYGVFVDGGRVGPGFLPVLAGGLTAILCGWVALGSVRGQPSRPGGAAAGAGPHAAGDTDPMESGTDDDVDISGRSGRERIRNLWKVFGLTLGAILLVQVVGFLAAFGGLVFVISTWVERQALLKSAVIAAVATGLIYGVFGLFLHVPLPGGLLGVGTEG
ncbi:Tripartite tricarboxylate transporter TctB family protein [Micromonospora rhizosphaerae]|uniref:Tripartite tricarboxylate transporter TctB family protein n=1 Tax=Micromonospora rhizosphaerae TaxID=568872 RepID=A0A1C6SS43_9ACTN|nr:tripartite tricarboxylate transporter TctB family protein [Micromonospora rhizosphaerae]SCL32169.1 Tripartite tricarboxylate transporter TctB family protein [Micromonospora rhizosphaerae]